MPPVFLLDHEIAVRFSLPGKVENVNGYYPCPAPSCKNAYFSIVSIRGHFRKSHSPTQKRPLELRELRSECLRVEELMQSLGCQFEADLRLVICKAESCCHALDPKDLLHHLLGHGHVLKATGLRFVYEVLRPVGPEEFNAENPKAFHAIQGIPSFKCTYSCAEDGCGEESVRLEFLKAHFCTSHSGKALRIKPRQEVQSIFGQVDKYRVVMKAGEFLDEKGKIVNSEGWVVCGAEFHCGFRVVRRVSWQATVL